MFKHEKQSHKTNVVHHGPRITRVTHLTWLSMTHESDVHYYNDNWPFSRLSCKVLSINNLTLFTQSKHCKRIDVYLTGVYNCHNLQKYACVNLMYCVLYNSPATASEQSSLMSISSVTRSKVQLWVLKFHKQWISFIACFVVKRRGLNKFTISLGSIEAS